MYTSQAVLYSAPESFTMSIASDTDSVFSFEQQQHINVRSGFVDDDSSYSSDSKNAKKPSYVVRYDTAKQKRIKVNYVETSLTPNRYIRNAVTGIVQAPFRVGSADEDLFFSVMLSTGECGQTPPCLFYDSPEQYERHMYTELSEATKVAWREKYNDAIQKRNLKTAKHTESTMIH
jgi:hypothetical protein